VRLQSVAFWISARLAPFGRPINSRIFAPLLSARGVPASLVGAGLAAFLLALAPFFGVAPFFEEDFSGAAGAPCSATVAVCSVVVASTVFMLVNLVRQKNSWVDSGSGNLPSE
jgi:hypothetical protein